MNRKRLTTYGLLILFAIAVFYYRPFLENFYLFSKEKIADFAANPLSALSNLANKEISAPPPLRAKKNSARAYLTQEGVFQFTNSERQKNGGKALKENTKLDQAAQKKAQDILEKQYFEHVSPEGNGPDHFVSSAGYEYITIGENLALGNFENDHDLVTAWMESPGHRENILHPQFQEIGIAVLRGLYEGEITWIAVQEFGTNLSVCPEAEAGLKIQIDLNTSQVDNLEIEIKNKQAVIRKMNPRDSDYAQAVRDYNLLVEKYNALVAKTKSLIAKYNNQVEKYNSCVKSYDK